MLPSSSGCKPFPRVCKFHLLVSSSGAGAQHVNVSHSICNNLPLKIIHIKTSVPTVDSFSSWRLFWSRCLVGDDVIVDLPFGFTSYREWVPQSISTVAQGKCRFSFSGKVQFRKRRRTTAMTINGGLNSQRFRTRCSVGLITSRGPVCRNDSA